MNSRLALAIFAATCALVAVLGVALISNAGKADQPPVVQRPESPFKGGTLVPVPVSLMLPLATSPSGDAPLPWTAWPAGLSGLDLYFQYAIQDAGAVHGVALSNAVKADVP